MRRSILAVLGASIFLMLAASSAAAVTVQQWNTATPYIARRDLFPRDLTNGHLVTNVVLPTGYKTRSCWPVLYLLHGTAGPPTNNAPLQWLQLDNGLIKRMGIPAVLVIPGGGDMWYVNNWWGGLRHPGFEDWVLDTIVPMVTKRLHICSARQYHSIAGLSMGGYGAIYLASQLPSYFGSAGSFSGVLSPEAANFVEAFGPTNFDTYWGPPGKFYAVGHDPLALVQNLKHTRLFVSAGNGVPLPGEDNSLTARFEETEFDQESLAFTAAARRAGDSVKFEQFVGTHTTQTWFSGLNGMLAWKPFAPVPNKPSKWTFSTVNTIGTTWGYSWAFQRPPTGIEQFTLSNGVFEANGSGVLVFTPPGARHRIIAPLPFKLRNGVVTELHGVKPPHLVGGYSGFAPVTVKVSPKTVSSTTEPITVSFKTQQTLPRGYEYQIAVASIAGSSCSAIDGLHVAGRPKGKVQSTVVNPVTDGFAYPGSTTKPATAWCTGPAYAAVTVVKGAQLLGTIIGYTTFNVT